MAHQRLPWLCAYLHFNLCNKAIDPATPRLALSRTSKSINGLPGVVWKAFHFHWLMHSAIKVMNEPFVKVVKKARKVLRVMCMGSSGRARPS